MWQIDNRTAFAAGQSWVRDLDGAETWLVAVRATFAIQSDGTTAVAADQPKAAIEPLYRGEPGKSSLLCENDFVLGKVTTDVVVNGTAHAPHGQATDSVDVGLQLGGLRKILKVFGDRTWNSSGRGMSSPVPFLKMPLEYERAFGGVDAQSPQPDTDWYWPNPVGVGFVTARERAGGIKVPNIEYPGELIRGSDERPRPAGFGFVCSHWQDRAALTGTHDQAWMDKRHPLPPTDFDMRHFQAVPRDQQTSAFLVGGETVSLLNLTPQGILHFRIPHMQVAFETRFMDGERREHAPTLHTVLIEPDFPRVSLVWHSALECHAKSYQLDKTKVTLTSLDGVAMEQPVDNLLELVS